MASSKIILNKSFYANTVDSITSVPSPIATLPLVNTLNGMRHLGTRIPPSGNTLTITITLVSAMAIDAVGIGGFSLTTGATGRCVVKNASSSVIYDSGTAAIYATAEQASLPWFSRTRFWFSDTSLSAKTIEITLNDSLANVDLSHIVFGPDYTPSLNPDWGATWSWNDTSIQQRTAGGSLLVNPAYGFRKVQVAWANLPVSDYDRLSGLMQVAGQSLMFSLFPGIASKKSSDFQMIGRIATADGVNLVGHNLLNLGGFILEEI